MPEYRNYNPNTKYGRRKAREQAYNNYKNGTPEYRQSVDEIGCVVWGIIIAIALIIFIIIGLTKGPESAIDWIK